jgi:hypothetical protein
MTDRNPSLRDDPFAPVAPTSMPAPEFDDYPEYHAEAMGCGLEDQGITDRYEAMRHGWDQAGELIAERIDNFLAVLHDDHLAALEAARAEGARLMQEAAAKHFESRRILPARMVRHVNNNYAMDENAAAIRAIDIETVLKGKS